MQLVLFWCLHLAVGVTFLLLVSYCFSDIFMVFRPLGVVLNWHLGAISYAGIAVVTRSSLTFTCLPILIGLKNLVNLVVALIWWLLKIESKSYVLQ